MRFLLLVVVVALAVTDVSGGRWWRRVKTGARQLWTDNKDTIIRHGTFHDGIVNAKGLNLLLSGRSIEDVDQNGDGVLTRSELLQHMNERDVDDLLDMLDENGERQVTRDVLERYANEALLNTNQ